MQLKGPKEDTSGPDTSSERIFSDSRSPVKLLAAQGLHRLPPALPPQVSWMPLHVSLPAQKTLWALCFVTLLLTVPPSARWGQPTGCKEHSSTWLNVNRLQSTTKCLSKAPAVWKYLPLQFQAINQFPRSQTQRDTPLVLLPGSSKEMLYGTSVW